MGLSKEDLARKLSEIRSKENSDAIRSVASDLYYSGEFIEASQLDTENALLDRMFLAYSNKTKENRVIAEDPASCPLCKARLTPIKLDQQRKAVWCSRHFVVYPYRE